MLESTIIGLFPTSLFGLDEFAWVSVSISESLPREKDIERQEWRCVSAAYLTASGPIFAIAYRASVDR